MTATLPANVYNHFDSSKNYDEILFIPDRAIQTAEFNELQSRAAARLKDIADGLYHDGNIISGADVLIDAASGATTCNAGGIYVAGEVRQVAAASLTLAVTGNVTLGLYLHSSVISELDDPSLVDPAAGTTNFQQPGALRLKTVAVWGFSGDGQSGDFYPIYTVQDGVLLNKQAPPTIDGVTQALASNDVDTTGGSFVVTGMLVSRLADNPDGTQVYSVSAGRAHVLGYPVRMATAMRLLYAAQPDLQAVISEPTQSVTVNAQRINCAFVPVESIQRVVITAQATRTITHGAYAGCTDPLPDASVLSIIAVSQGGTIYHSGTDFTFHGNALDWIPSGGEPATGSSYSATYQYQTTVQPSAVDGTGFTVTGAVAGSLILTDYTWALPRYDRLALAKDGSFTWVKGVAAKWNPQAPACPDSLLPLALVLQTWDSNRSVNNDGVRNVPMSALSDLQKKMDYVLTLFATQQLSSHATVTQQGVYKGLLVDPFIDDSKRDAGIAQNAAIFGGQLTLPVASAVKTPSSDIAAPILLPYQPVRALEQPMRSSSLKVNPYQSFAPIPAIAELQPAIDNWTDVQTQWAGPITQFITAGHYVPGVGGILAVYTSSSANVLSVTDTLEQNLRQISVHFSLDGFGPNELLTQVLFYGIDVTPAGVHADANGHVAGSFTIPAGIPAGTYAVTFAGSGGSIGKTTFTGQGISENQMLQSVTQVTTVYWDPVAQLFLPPASGQVARVGLFFTAVGTSPVRVQIRDTLNGNVGQTVLAETQLSAAQITPGVATYFNFARPCYLHAGTEYAITVMSDDATTSVAIAVLGEWDSASGHWITAQPYNIGALLTSRNASTWTARQDATLTFSLDYCAFTATSEQQSLGTVAVNNATDLMLLAVSDTPASGATVNYTLTLPDGSVYNVDSGQPLRLPAAISGAIAVSANLHGTAGVSPLLYSGLQLIAGTVSLTGTYVSDTVAASANTRVHVVVDAVLPGGSSLTVEVQDSASNAWIAVPNLSSAPIGNGGVTLVYELTGFNSTGAARVRLTVTGTLTARPVVENLRVLML